MSTDGVRNNGLGLSLGFKKRGRRRRVKPKGMVMGHRTGETNGELEEGWNANTEAFEYKHPMEWERLQELRGKPTKVTEDTSKYDNDFPPLPSAKPKAPPPGVTAESIAKKVQQFSTRLAKQGMAKGVEDVKFLLKIGEVKEASSVLDDLVEQMLAAEKNPPKPKAPATAESLQELLQKNSKRIAKLRMEKAAADVDHLITDEQFEKAEDELQRLIEKLDAGDVLNKRLDRIGGRMTKMGMATTVEDVKFMIQLGEFEEARVTMDEAFEHLGVIEMHEIDKGKGGAGGVHVQNSSWKGGAEARLRIERKATTKMRAELTDKLNDRLKVKKGEKMGPDGKGVIDNCSMASGLAKALKEDPEMLKDKGIFSRIVGPVEGQGQHKKGKTAEEISDSIAQSVERLKSGKGTGDDGNLVLQFMGCFVDGLTEINEGNDVAKKQLDKLWPLLGLKDEMKEKLMNRVKGYKEIANASADTGEGKGTRKDETRKGLLPEDERHQIFDENALIKGDISGSMHSCLLAQELAETLFGGEEPTIKEMGEPVLVKNKKLLNARAMDALALTAGGKIGSNDIVFHTAYEMINGMQGITGIPTVSQPIATEIMDQMTKGVSFTDAVEKIYKGETFPWMV